MLRIGFLASPSHSSRPSRPRPFSPLGRPLLGLNETWVERGQGVEARRNPDRPVDSEVESREPGERGEVAEALGRDRVLAHAEEFQAGHPGDRREVVDGQLGMDVQVADGGDLRQHLDLLGREPVVLELERGQGRGAGEGGEDPGVDQVADEPHVRDLALVDIDLGAVAQAPEECR